MTDPSLQLSGPRPRKAKTAPCKYCKQVFKILPGKRTLFCSKKCSNASRSRPLIDRFMEKVQKTEECWIFTGTKIRGYGCIGLGQGHEGYDRRRYAHCLSWIIHNGPIPVGQKVLHKCDNPPCVNPAHLFLGDDKDNQRDRAWKRRGSVHMIEAFGECKPLFAWLEDPRCIATSQAIRWRLNRGFSGEYAITRTPLTRFEISLSANICRALTKLDATFY
jgi:hypothetical protein